MATKKSPVTYIRDKDRVEISGEFTDVKKMIWFDLFTSKLKIRYLLLLVKVPVTTWLPAIWQWVKYKLPFLTLLAVAVNYILLLSG